MIARAFLAAWAEATEQARSALDALDAAAGDGDHGSTVARGAAAAAQVARGADEDDRAGDRPQHDGELLVQAARAFTDAAGGASGPLLGVVLRELGRAWGDGPLDDDRLGAGLTAAVDAVARLGRTHPGDGTLLDALAAAAVAPGEAASHARAAARATADVEKRKGRAALVAGAGFGHEDPGARSVALLLSVLDEVRAGAVS